MDKLKFAIIGCGRIARRHAEQIARCGHLAAVCDIVKERAEELGNQYHANYYESVDDLLRSEQGLDVAVICTPNGLHAAHAIQALRAGVHVLCEKPMAIRVKDCGEMIQAAERANRRLFAIKQNRFNPPVAAVKALLDEGRLGRVYSFQVNCFWNRNADYYKSSWKGTKDLDGGTLFTQFSHFIDLLYWMFGDVRNVQAYLANYAHQHQIEFEDTGVAILEFHSGVMGALNYTVNSFKQNMEGSLTIFAEKGTVKIGGQYLNEMEYIRMEGDPLPELPKGNKANDYGHYQGSMSNHDKVYDNLIDVLQHNAPISTSSFEGLKTVEIIERIYAAAEKVAFAETES